MPELRIDRVDDEFGHVPLVQASVRLLGRAQHVGALADLPAARTLDRLLLRDALSGLAAAGVAVWAPAALAAARAPADLGAVVRSADADLERTPVPDLTLPVALGVLGPELLAGLLDVAADQLAPASGVVARRLHHVALMTADLAGSYADAGVRRWFARSRRALDGRSPAQALAGGFEPDADVAREVRGLAAALTRLGAT